MKNAIRTVSAVLAICALLQIGVTAYEIPQDFSEQTPETILTDYMHRRGLHEDNFSVSYYDTVTGEAYAFNDTKMMVAASTYKLPLNMYYYELERDGLLAPDAYIPRADASLDVCHRRSLVDSNNDLSIGMLYNLGTFRTYKECMRKYFTMTDEEIDPLYYANNYYCTRMMMDALRYLYDNSGDFEEMLGYMKQAQPESYFRSRVTEVEIAHKYGLFEGAVNDVGIFYTPSPFLLAVYTQDVSASVVGEVAELMTAYSLWQHRQAEEEAARQAAEETRKAEEEAARRAEEEAARRAAEEEAARRAAAEAERQAAEEAARQAEEESARRAEEEAVRQAALDSAAAERRRQTIIGAAVVAGLLALLVLVLCRAFGGSRSKKRTGTRK